MGERDLDLGAAAAAAAFDHARYDYGKAILGDGAFRHCTSARVLMVGAGGIGCELLKNLVMTGFRRITVIDLDTVDLTNLNRQFLFSTRHIKKAKAVVARETALEFNARGIVIEAIHGTIKDPGFDVAWFRRFRIVLNALDNLDARRHVNMMCCAARIPLVESGTTGFLGQAQPMMKDVTECYDCTSKPVQKSYPVCTIRSTPSAPIHCIVWAKSYLLNQLFGVGEEETSELESALASGENAEEINQLRKEANALKGIKESIGSDDYAEKVFTKVFDQDIQRLVSLKDMWKSRKAPEPLSYSVLSKQTRLGQNGVNGANGHHPHKPELFPARPVTLKDHTQLDRVASFQLFLSALERLVERSLGSSSEPITFDKDDETTLDFVVGAANLRASSFGIEAKTKFEVKEMAGNIIPAIATTNAIVAGLVVLQALKVLRQDWRTARTAHFSKKADKAFALEQLSQPNPLCAVCRNAYVDLQVHADQVTLSDLRQLASDRLALGDELVITEGERLLYDPDFDDNEGRTLDDLDCGPGKMVKISDEAGKMYPVIFVVSANLGSDEPFIIGDLPKLLERPRDVMRGTTEDPHESVGTSAINGRATSVLEVSDDFEILPEPPQASPNKRKRSASDLASVSGKRLGKQKSVILELE